jgi:hypothetical protein
MTSTIQTAEMIPVSGRELAAELAARSPGPGPNLAAIQRQPARPVTRGAAQPAEREALDDRVDAATHDNAATATHLNRPDLSHFLDTGQSLLTF